MKVTAPKPDVLTVPAQGNLGPVGTDYGLRTFVDPFSLLIDDTVKIPHLNSKLVRHPVVIFFCNIRDGVSIRFTFQ